MEEKTAAQIAREEDREYERRQQEWEDAQDRF